MIDTGIRVPAMTGLLPTTPRLRVIFPIVVLSHFGRSRLLHVRVYVEDIKHGLRARIITEVGKPRLDLTHAATRPCFRYASR